MDRDFAKEKIGWYKVLIVLLFTSAASLLGWVVNNMNNGHPMERYGVWGFATFVFGVVFCVVRTKFYFKKFKNIGE